MAAAMLTTAGSASASTLPPVDGGWDHVYSQQYVTVYVEEHGDYIYVCDEAPANGDPAYLWVRIGGYLYWSATATGGAGTCAGHDASDGGDYDLPEGATVSLTYSGVTDTGTTSWPRWTSTFVNDH